MMVSCAVWYIWCCVSIFDPQVICVFPIGYLNTLFHPLIQTHSPTIVRANSRVPPRIDPAIIPAVPDN